MEMNEKKNSITEVMQASMAKIREMVDSNTIVGEPITTPDGVTLIPVSRLSAGAGAGGRVEPMAFLVVKDGVTRMLPVAAPAITTVDRAIELVPQVLDRVESFIDRKKAEKETY